MTKKSPQNQLVAFDSFCGSKTPGTPPKKRLVKGKIHSLRLLPSHQVGGANGGVGIGPQEHLEAGPKRKKGKNEKTCTKNNWSVFLTHFTLETTREAPPLASLHCWCAARQRGIVQGPFPHYLGVEDSALSQENQAY